MFFLISTGQPRPSILTKNKDADYHSNFARYCIGQSNNQLQAKFFEKIQLNKNFYKGNQWIHEEDVEVFLKDDSNQERNRISFVHNLIRPMIEQYRGNAIRMSMNFKVKSISPQAINRREEKLAETLFYSKIANQPGNPFGDQLKKDKAIGDNEGETRSIFENIYVDHFVRDMNYLAGYVSERNEFDEKQVRIAEEMGLSGLAVMKQYEYAGHQIFKVVPSDTFFFDRSAREYNLSDAGYMGDVTYMEPSEIFEMWPDISDDERKAIDNYSTQYKKTNTVTGSTNVQYENSGKIPVFTTYWMDGEQHEYGYVLDEYGYEYLTKINFTPEGADKPTYTDKDLIQSKSTKANRILRGGKKRKLHYDVLRMAIMIPKEILSSTSSLENEKLNDVLLDWGITPYQETENLDFGSVKYPYKCYCWGYVDGEILSPIDDAIDPQRFINRMWSVSENQINNSRGSGTVIDKTMVDDEDEVLRAMNQSKPVFINAKGRGIQNAIGQYDTTIKNGTMVMFNIIDAMKSSMQDITGINEAIKGESTGSDQLVGVTQLMIQRGSLMQEPFYNGVTQVFKQCFQSICSVGKRIYADNERNITIAVGDEGARVIRITKEYNMEDFRCFVKRENSDDLLISASNQMLLQFKQLMMLDDARIANLWNRSSPDEVAEALRSYAKEKQELARMAQKDAAAKEKQLMGQAQQEQAEVQEANAESEARADITDIQNKKFELHKENLKALTKIAPKNKAAENLILQNAENSEM